MLLRCERLEPPISQMGQYATPGRRDGMSVARSQQPHALAREMDGGSIELMPGEYRVRAVLQLSSPSAVPTSDAESLFQSHRRGYCAGDRNSTSARIVGMGGAPRFLAAVSPTRIAMR